MHTSSKVQVSLLLFYFKYSATRTDHYPMPIAYALKYVLHNMTKPGI